jgi:hypothetical protein
MLEHSIYLGGDFSEAEEPEDFQDETNSHWVKAEVPAKRIDPEVPADREHGVMTIQDRQYVPVRRPVQTSLPCIPDMRTNWYADPDLTPNVSADKKPINGLLRTADDGNRVLLPRVACHVGKPRLIAIIPLSRVVEDRNVSLSKDRTFSRVLADGTIEIRHVVTENITYLIRVGEVRRYSVPYVYNVMDECGNVGWVRVMETVDVVRGEVHRENEKRTYTTITIISGSGSTEDKPNSGVRSTEELSRGVWRAYDDGQVVSSTSMSRLQFKGSRSEIEAMLEADPCVVSYSFVRSRVFQGGISGGHYYINWDSQCLAGVSTTAIASGQQHTFYYSSPGVTPDKFKRTTTYVGYHNDSEILSDQKDKSTDPEYDQYYAGYEWVKEK